MADLIDRAALIEWFMPYVHTERDIQPESVIEDIKAAPAVDAVSREVFEQVQWERDIAIAQLAEYGVGFGEKKKDLVEVKHGRWIFDTGIDYCHKCSECQEMKPPHYISTNFCPNCGADMRERKG